MNSQNDSKAAGDDNAIDQPASASEAESKPDSATTAGREYGGPKGLEPTRYGDWEKQGRCIDF